METGTHSDENGGIGSLVLPDFGFDLADFEGLKKGNLELREKPIDGRYSGRQASEIGPSERGEEEKQQLDDEEVRS